MAILKAPLFSLGASQQLGKALVFFGWKGLNVVREYVIPANPKTTLQTTQRGYMTAAVAKIHEIQGTDTRPFNAIDVTAFALWASVVQAATTWFNQVCRNWLDQKVAGKIPNIWRNGSAVGGSLKLIVSMVESSESSSVTSGKLYYGVSKTALINSIAATRTELAAGKDIPGLTAGVKYYVQFRPLLPATFIGSNSGIYYGVPTA